jgi:hypothetical protein
MKVDAASQGPAIAEKEAAIATLEAEAAVYKGLVQMDYKCAFIAATGAMRPSAPTHGGTQLTRGEYNATVGCKSSSDSAGLGQVVAADETVEAEMKALFDNEKYKLDSLCADVCQGLAVKCRVHLAKVETQDLDELPKYVKDKLKPFHSDYFAT